MARNAQCRFMTVFFTDIPLFLKCTAAAVNENEGNDFKITDPVIRAIAGYRFAAIDDCLF